MEDSHWTTKLSYTSEDGIVIRGYDLIQMIGTVPFPSVLYLLFTGELPEPKIAKLIDALMVASIDHGPGAPSVLAARTAASGGAPLGAAAAAGLLTLNKFHGAAVEDSMESIERVFTLSHGETGQLDRAADAMVAEWRQAGRRIAGFGHRQHKKTDPRLERLFELAREAEVPGMHLEAARAIVRALQRSTGKELPINIDGATAAILCEINFPRSLSNALFMVARITGILAHANEEITQMPPMRRIDPVNHGYEGPPPRSMESKDKDKDQILNRR
ncbi:MAG TPA: citryl-CoA lyase [Anaerolineales bacterium]|nr:citryl-CoA lyase [Anaerolineales bacterium]